jgi:single-strand DNA-binding protein
MTNVNKCFYIGNLTRDMEVKDFDGGGKVGNTAVAVNESYKAKDGTKKEIVTFINLEFPEHLIEHASKMVKKGRLVHIEGKTKLREYEKDGQKHTGHSVRVDDYTMLDPKPKEAEA